MGLGHVMRSAALAEAALRRGSSIRIFFEGDPSARRAWRTASPQSEDIPLRAWSDYPAGPPSPIAFLDYPTPKNEWIESIRRHGSHSVVLDDPRSVDRADMTINPALHHARTSPNAEAQSRSLDGPVYSILAEPHRQTKSPSWHSRTNLLLSIGGADPHGATPKLGRWVSEVLASPSMAALSPLPFTHKHAVLGASFQDPEHCVRHALAEAGWQIHSALTPKDMAHLMASARLAIMGFGTSLTELAWHGTPHLSVTHHRFDIAHAESLELRGVGRHLGQAEGLDPAITKQRLQRGLADAKWQESSARTALSLIHI